MEFYRSVFRGELQCRMLGMAIEAFTTTGVPAPSGESGELVCTKPFPCQPVRPPSGVPGRFTTERTNSLIDLSLLTVLQLGFWPLAGYGSDADVAAAEERFRQSYFDEFKQTGVWYHGDHVMITPSREGNGGGVIMLGRSDGVL